MQEAEDVLRLTSRERDRAHKQGLEVRPWPMPSTTTLSTPSDLVVAEAYADEGPDPQALPAPGPADGRDRYSQTHEPHHDRGVGHE